MDQTSHSLLEQLAQQGESAAWQRLFDLYAPLLLRWLRQYEIQSSDADDLVQEVLIAACRELPQFEHNGRPGAFRAWLRTTLVHRVRDFWRRRQRQPRAANGTAALELLDQLEDPHSHMTAVWNREHDEVLVQRLLQIVEGQFNEATRTAFRRTALEGASVGEVAEELSLSHNAVTIAKHRVLKALRKAGRGMLGEE